MKHSIDCFKHTSKQKKKYGLDECLRKDFIKKDGVSDDPQDYINDIVLGLGLAYVIEKRGLAKKGTFFIVEGGMPHLPFMAAILRYYNIEPFFCLEKRKDVNPEDYYQNFAYFCDGFSSLERGDLVARVFDTHSYVNRDENIPSFRELKKKNVERVAILLEGSLTLNEFYNTESEFEKMFSGERESLKPAYERLSNHFEVVAYEIDPRTSKHSYDLMLDFLKENEDLQEFLWEVWGKEKYSKEELIKMLEDFGERWFE